MNIDKLIAAKLEIAELKKTLATMVNVADGAVILRMRDKQEIEELKSELEQHDDQITNIEEANKEISDVANDKIVELMGMVDHLKEFITTQSDYCFDTIEINGEEIRPKVLAHEAVWKTPTQCLASVKADVIKDFDKWCLEHHKMSMCSDGFLEQLREQK
jgi:predicted methyltransferase